MVGAVLMECPMLPYPPEQSLMMGIAVFVGGILIFALTLLAVRMLTKKGSGPTGQPDPE